MNTKDILADLRERLLGARGSSDYGAVVASATDMAEEALGRELTQAEYEAADKGKVYLTDRL